MLTLVQKPIYKLHIEHKQWLNKLAFYEEEIAWMQKRIEELASKNTNIDAIILVEHYRNQLSVQREYIEVLKHDINEHEAYLQKKISQHPALPDQRKTADHPHHRSEIESFEKNYDSARKDLIDFLCRVF